MEMYERNQKLHLLYWFLVLNDEFKICYKNFEERDETFTHTYSNDQKFCPMLIVLFANKEQCVFLPTEP